MRFPVVCRDWLIRRNEHHLRYLPNQQNPVIDPGSRVANRSLGPLGDRGGLLMWPPAVARASKPLRRSPDVKGRDPK